MRRRSASQKQVYWSSRVHVAVRAALGGDGAVLPGKPAQLIRTWRSRAALAWPGQPVCHSVTRWTAQLRSLSGEGSACSSSWMPSVPWEAVFIKNRPIHHELMPVKLVSPSPAPELSPSSPGSTGGWFHTELMEGFFVSTELLLGTKKTGA